MITLHCPTCHLDFEAHARPGDIAFCGHCGEVGGVNEGPEFDPPPADSPIREMPRIAAIQFNIRMGKEVQHAG